MNHTPHPHIDFRKHLKPQHAGKAHEQDLSLNDRIAIFICKWAGTMWAAYLFTLIAFIALPQAIESHSLTVLINWFSGNWMQFVLLPIIIVGQDIAGRKINHMIEESYKNSQLNYKDGEAILEITDAVHGLIKTNNEDTVNILKMLQTVKGYEKKQVKLLKASKNGVE